MYRQNRFVETFVTFMMVFWPTLGVMIWLMSWLSLDPLLSLLLVFVMPIITTTVVLRYDHIKVWYARYVSPCRDCQNTNVQKDHSGRCPQCHEKTVAEDAEELAQRHEESLRQQERARLAEMARREAFKRQCRTLEGLKRLSGKDFEQVVGAVFSAEGYDVRYTPATGDEGVDLHVRRGDHQAIVQCKNWNKPVGVKEVRELYGVMMQKRIDSAYLITTSYFTEAAIKFQRSADNLLLVEGKGFLAMHKKAGLPLPNTIPKS